MTAQRSSSDCHPAEAGRAGPHHCGTPARREHSRSTAARRDTSSPDSTVGAFPWHRFLGFLRERGTLPAEVVSRPVEDPRLSAFRLWLSRHRGTTDETVRRYLYEASRWLPALGTDTAAYDAVTVRRVVLEQEPQRARASVQLTVTVLRTYLSFLAVRGECRPELVHAVPPAPRRRLATLPRYAGPDVIERIVSATWCFRKRTARSKTGERHVSQAPH